MRQLQRNAGLEQRTWAYVEWLHARFGKLSQATLENGWMRGIKMPVDPTWERDELILALDLYFRHYPTIIPSASHPDVVELSQFLNSLDLIPLEQRTPSFRNPDGVAMKLQNF